MSHLLISGAGVLLEALVVVLLIGLAGMRHEQRLMRERRRHAERTVRAMHRMTQIRRKTIKRMDRAERRRRP